MLTLLKRLNYRDRVLETLGALLVAYPRGRQFTRDFPTLRRAIKQDFEAEKPHQIAALELAASILSTLAEQLDPQGRAAACAVVQRFAWRDLKSLAARRLAGEKSAPQDGAHLIAELIGGAVYICRRMVDEGTLGRAEYAGFLDTLDGILGSSEGEPRIASRFKLD
jgi:hypothetical protein